MNAYISPLNYSIFIILYITCFIFIYTKYSEIVGFGQCGYIIVWLSDAKVTAVTNRSGPSIAGCGLGSKEVDWGQMPIPELNINIRTGKI